MIGQQKEVQKLKLLHKELTGTIRQTAFEVHKYFGPGFAEKVYENSLANRLRKKSVIVEQQVLVRVYDEDGTIVGEYVADLLLEKIVIVELKAVSALTDQHFSQLLNYLKATEIKVGLLINFGTSKLQVRRFVT
ncbi:MAG: GxxExxY protein [Candidatus Marinimicrobia bacterium]|nr:GxxExxY protein [Candidatus Neomarinimicrobiota bacterium]